jgi:hypothetical protein
MKYFTIILLFSNFNLYASCDPIDLTSPDYLKSVGKENLIKHFSSPRDQDGVGWCGAYAPTDSLSFAVGEPVSAVDISINQYANEKSSLKLDKLSGITPLSANKVASENGYCPESVIPSDQTSSSNLGHYAILNMMEAFQKISDDYIARGKPKDYCVKCSTDLYEKVIKPALPNVTTDMIQEVLIKNQGDSLAAVRDLMNKLCEGKRKKIDPEYEFVTKRSLSPKKISTYLDEALNSKSMPSIGMNTSFFAKDEVVPGGHGDHEMMVVARRMGKNGKCEYLVRNSWGRGCSYYKEPMASNCEPDKGSIWMDNDTIERGVTDVLVIKNVDPNKKKEEKPSIFGSNKPAKNDNQNQKPVIDNKIDPPNNGESSGGSIFQRNENNIQNIFSGIAEFFQTAMLGLSTALTSVWEALSNYFKY